MIKNTKKTNLEKHYLEKHLKKFSKFLVGLKEKIYKSEFGYVRINDKTVTLNSKGVFIVYDDSYRSSKHRYGKQLNKDEVREFLVNASKIK